MFAEEVIYFFWYDIFLVTLQLNFEF
jgi:hypothetical protein